MTLEAPRDPHSEVVDNRRRWMPDWYSWLSATIDGINSTISGINTTLAGFVVGPGSATDNAVARYDATTGKLVQNSSFLVDDSGNVSSFGGQLKFPATQSASSDVNTLDDYEEGSWTPVITFVTPGTLSIAYSIQAGKYIKIGKLVFVKFYVSAGGGAGGHFTLGTASGNCLITGLPFTVGTDGQGYGPLQLEGVTKAGYTMFVAEANALATDFTLLASGSGQPAATITAADTPTGGPITFISSLSYIASG